MRFARILPFLVIAALWAGCAQTGPVATTEDPGIIVAMIDNHPITLDEFEQQYMRTTVDTLAAASDSMGAYVDFLERYVDFRLKVKEAIRAGYAERPDLIQEMETYRTQLARPYLLEQEVVDPLIEELYARKQEMVDVSHILIRVGPDAPPADTMRAFGRLSAIVDSIGSGVSFSALALRNSQDPSARTDPNAVGYEGRLGFFAGGRMVKPFEDRMFTTAQDSISDIFRTQFGYHVLKVHDRRPTMSDVRVSHIMIQPKGQAPADSADAQARLQVVVDRLDQGEPFADVASELSEDRASAQKGGDLDFISYDGWLPPVMRDAAFAADSLGAVIGPIKTRFGYHMLTVTDRRELPSFDESYEDLKGEVSRLPRSEQAEKSYARSLRRTFDTRIDSSNFGMVLASSSPDSLINIAIRNALPEEMAARRIASMADSTFTIQQFLVFAGASGSAASRSNSDRLNQTMDAFLNEKAISQEIYNLQDRDPSFRRTMAEFNDGLMLFRLMEDSVWTAAASDSVALQALFESQSDLYQYPDRTRILSITARDDSVMTMLSNRLAIGMPYAALLEAYAADSTASVRFDTTHVEGPTDSVYDQALDLPEGAASEPLSYAGGKILLINDGIDPARAKSFEEARAEVITEYQAIVEKRLIDRLRSEFSVQTFPERLDQAFSSYRQMP